jgi:hypothetical protein
MLLASSSGRALCKNLSRLVPLAKTRPKATLTVQLLSVFTVTSRRCRLSLRMDRWLPQSNQYPKQMKISPNANIDGRRTEAYDIRIQRKLGFP